MKLDTNKFNAIVEAAKLKAASEPRWLRAIEKAAAGILSGELIVTTLQHGALVTTPNGTYAANGHCNCEAARRGHTQCKHRAAARLMDIYERETAPAAVSFAYDAPILPLKEDETRNRCAVCGRFWTANYESSNCPIHADQDPERWQPPAPADETAEVLATKAATGRDLDIAYIQSAWPKTWPPLYVELLARFGKSELNMLDDDSLRRVRLAIAM
jgi:hypothetical protein